MLSREAAVFEVGKRAIRDFLSGIIFNVAQPFAHDMQLLEVGRLAISTVYGVVYLASTHP